MVGDVSACSNVQNDIKREALGGGLPLKDKNRIELSIKRGWVVGDPGLARWVSTYQRLRSIFALHHLDPAFHRHDPV